MTTGSRAVDFPRISAWAVVIGVSALFVLVPLAWWPKDPYGLIKWVLVGAVAIVASSLRLAAFFSSGEASFRRNAINLPLALLLLWSCLSLWIGPDRYYVRGRLYELLLLALLYAAIVSSADSPARRLFLAIFAPILLVFKIAPFVIPATLAITFAISAIRVSAWRGGCLFFRLFKLDDALLVHELEYFDKLCL